MSPAGPPPGPLLVDSHVTRTRHAGLRTVTTCHYFSASSRWAPGTPGFDQSRIAASAPRDPDHDLETAICELYVRTHLVSRSLDAPVQREGVVARGYCDKRTP